MARSDARLLVLGSLPGAESLRQQRYYAHPRNAFWPIMAELCGFASDAPYDDRCEGLIAQGIALWDVCAAAKRAGSLDAAIEAPRANDFAGFLTGCPGISRVCFNGRTAEALWRRLVAPGLGRADLALTPLPSTSPAHAGMGFKDKREAWRAALTPS